MRNKTDLPSFACPHGGTSESCQKCLEIRSIIGKGVPDYDPHQGLRGDTGDGLAGKKATEAWLHLELERAGHGGVPAIVERMRIRGSRRSRIYEKRLLMSGTRIDRVGQLIDSSRARELGRNGARVIQTVGLSVAESPMRRLYGLLLDALFREAVPGYQTVRRRPRLKRGEWSHNLAWARWRLSPHGARVARHPEGIDRELVRGLQQCPACHTPILAGCRLGGKLITRRRPYCDDRCKMRAYRQRAGQHK